MIGVCCLQEVRWRGKGFMMLEVDGMIYELWWSWK